MSLSLQCTASQTLLHMSPHRTSPQVLHQLREACSSQVLKALARRRGKGEAQESSRSSSSGRAAGKGGPAGSSRRSSWGPSQEDVLGTADQGASAQPQQAVAVTGVTGVTGDAADPKTVKQLVSGPSGLEAADIAVPGSAIVKPVSEANGPFETVVGMPMEVPELSGGARVIASLSRAAEAASGLRKLAERQAQALARAQLQPGSKVSSKEGVSGRWDFSRAGHPMCPGDPTVLVSVWRAPCAGCWSPA